MSNGVFRYAEGSEPKKDRVPEEAEETEEVREERKDSKQPAPAEKGTNTYERGDSSTSPYNDNLSGGGTFPDRS